MIWNYTQFFPVPCIISRLYSGSSFFQSQNPTPRTTAKMIRPTKIYARTFTRNTAIAIIINNTITPITPIITVPIVPVIPMFTLDVQASDHILQSSFR
jgi:hypothetical protein